MNKCEYRTFTAPPEFWKIFDGLAKMQLQKKSEFLRAAVMKYNEFLHRDFSDPKWKFKS